MSIIRNKRVIIAIVVALVAVSTVFFVMNDYENSSAADPYDSNIHVAKIGGYGYETLQAACDDAVDGNVIIVTKDIILDTTLVIVDKQLTLTTDCGATIRPADVFTPMGPGDFENNLIDILMSTSGKQFFIGSAVTDNDDEILKLNGDDKCRVLRYRGASTTLVLNAANITGGKDLIGGGIFVSYGGAFEMHGGIVKGNSIREDYWQGQESDYRYSTDLLFSAGTNAHIHGGTVGSIFHRADKDCAGAHWGTHIHGGTIENVYIFSYPNGNVSTFTYHKEPGLPGGTVGHVYLATLGHNNDTDTFDHTEIKQPFTNNETVKPGDHVAKVNGFGYKTVEEAIENANDGDTVYIVNNANITSTYTVNKNVKIVIAPNYETNVNGEGKHSPKPKENGVYPSTQYVIQNQQNLMISISIDLNGGSMDLPTGWTENGGKYTKSYPYGTPYSDVIAEIDKTPTISGYSFVEWSPSTGKVGDVTPVISAMYNFSYTITLDKGINGVEDKFATVVYGGTALTSFTDIDAIYTEGFTLSGYYTAAEGGTRILDAGGAFASDNIDGYIVDGKWIKAEDCVLYVRWSPDGYLSTLDGTPPNGYGEVSYEFYCTQMTIISQAELKGHTVTGYETNTGVLIFDINGNFVSDNIEGFVKNGRWIGGLVGFAAVGTPNTYNITLNEGTGDNPGSAKIVYGTSSLIDLKHATKVGYEIVGYYTKNDESGTMVIDAEGNLVSAVLKYVHNGNWIKDNHTTLYARWQIKTCEINIIGFNSSVEILTDYFSTSFTDHGFIAEPGYKLRGYFTSYDGMTMVADADRQFIGNVDGYVTNGVWTREEKTADLYAIFDPITYDIILNKGTGDVDGSAKVVFDSTTIPSEFKPATKKGYGLLGYYIGENGTDSKILEADGSLVNENIGGYISGGKWIRTDGCTLYAHWGSAETYGLTLNGNGGNDKFTTVQYDSTSVSMPSPSSFRTGFTLDGYYTAAEGGTKVLNANGSFAAANIDGFITDGKWSCDSPAELFAYWNGNPYTITLNGGGGTDGVAEVIYYEKELTSITHSTRTGYTLLGYYTSLSNTGEMVIDAEGKLFSGSVGGSYLDEGRWFYPGNVDLYAKWKLDTYDITLDMGIGGLNDGAATVHYLDTSVSISSHAVGDTGYELLGYFTHKDGGLMVLNADGSFAEPPNNNLIPGFIKDGEWIRDQNSTIYAHWVPVCTTIILHGVDSDGSATVKYGDEQPVITTEPTKYGHNAAWYSVFENSGVMDAPQHCLIGGNGTFANKSTFTQYFDSDGKWIYTESDTVDLYAVWLPLGFGLSLDVDYGNPGSNPGIANFNFGAKKMNISTPATLAGRTVTGYSYNGIPVIDTDGNIIVEELEDPDTHVKYITDYRWSTDNISGFNLRAFGDPLTYTIKLLDEEGGNVAGEAKIKYGEGSVTEITHPTKDGFVIQGYWYRDTIYAETQILSADGSILNNHMLLGIHNKKWGARDNAELYAKWTPANKVTFLPNGGTIDPSTGWILDSEGKYVKQFAEGTAQADILTELENICSKTGHTYGIPDINGDFGSNTLVITANWVPIKYKVTFRNYDGGLLLEKEFDYGTIPAYEGADPTKDPTVQFSYVFNGWSPNLETVSGAAEYTAVFDEVINKYTITFNNWDGTLLYEQEFDYGSMPVYTGAPAKEPTAQYTYVFKGWSPEMVSVIGEATYTAEFGEELNKYKATVVLNGGELHFDNGWIVDDDGNHVKYFDYGTSVAKILEDLGGYSLVGHYSTLDAPDGHMDEEGIIIIVDWDPHIYDLILHHGHEDIPPGEGTVTFGDTSAQIEADASRRGYTLSGYLSHLDGHMVLNTDGTFHSDNVDGFITNGKWSRASDHTLHAYWVPNVYDIILHHGGQGKAHGLAKVSFDGTYAKIDSHATKSGHKLTGYYTQAAGGVKVLNADGTFATTHVESILADGKWNMDTGHTLYAQWEIDSEEHKEMAKYAAIIALEPLIIIGAILIYIKRKA